MKQGGVTERTYTYDTTGRPDVETHTVSATSYAVKTAYDTSGRVQYVTYPASTHYPSGYKVQYLYNTYGFLDKVQDTQTTPLVYWDGQAQDAEGHWSDFDLGNGLTTERHYNAYTGLLKNVDTGTTLSPTGVQQDGYVFDALGNLERRMDYNQTVGTVALQEDFTYDHLNRLVTSQVLGLSLKTYAYDAIGNLTSKAGVAYTYGQNGAGPHAVTTAGTDTFAYDANGNQTTKNTTTRVIGYSPFNKPTSIAANGDTVTFTYGADRGRIRQVSNGGNDSIVYVAAAAARYEKQTVGTEVSHLHYIAAGGEVVAIYKSIVDGVTQTEERRYLHRDHLRSIAVVTNENGAALESFSFDPWGKRRNATLWTDATGTVTANETHRGFTGHEMLDSVGLVHMNGRVYDPELGRFLSADPFVQFPENAQSWNRYSYVLNNPLSFTDPSGFFIGKLFKAVKKLVKSVASFVGGALRSVSSIPVVGQLVQVAACIKVYTCVAYSGASTLANGGSLGDALLSAAIVGAQISALHIVGHGSATLGLQPVTGAANRIVAHGIVGGTFQAIRGGKFLAGFVAGGFTQIAGHAGLFGPDGVTGPGDLFGNAVKAAVVGGTASVLGGGKFHNGAITGTFSRMFNDLRSALLDAGDKYRAKAVKELRNF